MREESLYTFENGEHDDFNPELQPKGSYRKLVNGVRDENGQILTEKGTISKTIFPLGLELLGKFNLNGELIVFLCNAASTISEIGIVNSLNNYVPYISNRTGSGAFLQLSTNELSFSFSSPIDVQARVGFNNNRLIYFVDGINPNRRINLDNLPDEAGFKEDINLQFNFKVPRTVITNITDGGELKTGTYILGARYLTNSGNTTSIGILSTPAMIIDDSVNSQLADGAPPQTVANKSINITIENLDSNFPFLEIVAVTYLGIGNVPSYNIVGRVEINSSRASFRYYSDQQHLGALINEDFTVQPVIYKTAQHIQQKDNMLLLSGLTTNAFNLDFQSIANATTIKYDIEELSVRESMSSTVDGAIWSPNGVENGNPTYSKTKNVQVNINVSDINDYRKELNASLKVGWMRDEVYSLALVPIFKGGTEGFAYHIPGKDSFNSPANTNNKFLGTYVSSIDYPSGQGYPTGKIRHHKMPTQAQEPIISKAGTTTKIRVIKLTINLPSISLSLLKELQGFKIVKQERNISSNRRVVLQGTAKRFYQFNDFVTLIPSYGRLASVGLFAAGTTGINQVGARLFAFYAPDNIHGIIDDFNFTHVKRLGNYAGERVYDARAKIQDTPVFNLLNYDNPLSTTGFAAGAEVPLESDSVKIGAFDTSDYKKPGSGLNKGFNLPFSNIPVTSYLLQATVEHLVFSTSNTGSVVEFVQEENYIDDGEDDAYQVTSETPNIPLINILNIISNQYGELQNASYIECGSILFDIDGVSRKTFFGGDTYITKYALNIADAHGFDDDVIPISKSINYFYLETQGNYCFRHYEQDLETGNTSVPYFPKYRLLANNQEPLGLFNFNLDNGHSAGYNKQYSKQQDIESYVHKPVLFEEVTDYSNRTVRSEISFEGENADNYRIFLPNNYQDIPKDKGKITNTFVWNGKFYIHTERGLFLTYVNTREQIVTDLSQIVIGTGGVFTQPPTEIFDIEGGYVGTTSKWAGIVTPFGYFFISNNRGKVFQLIDTVKEISDTGKRKFFYNNIEVLSESPLEKIGYVAGFDYINSRYILTRLGENGFTYSYALKLNSWTGSHSYKPVWYINRDKDFLLYNASTLYALNIGERNNYLNNGYQQFELQLSLNLPQVSKVYDNISLIAKVTKEFGVHSPLDFFDLFQCNTIDQNTGELTLLVTDKFKDELQPQEVKVSFKGKEYRFAMPLDSVLESKRDSDILDVANLDLNKEYKGRLKNTYALCTFKVSSSREKDFQIDLSAIRLLYRKEYI